MKIFAPCMQCLRELGRPSFEPIIVDYYDDGIAYVTCSVGHKTAHLVQSSKFEILLESGATALLEEFTLEACASFSAALERFYEFALRVMCTARGISPEVYAKMFVEMARQSERQLGTFMLLYTMEFAEPYKLGRKITEFRNSVIHRGMIPTREEANKFASRVYSIILSLYQKLRARHDAHVMSVMMLGLEEKRAKVPNEMPIASNSCTMFFNTAKADIEPDFFKALDAFKKASQMISDSIPHMQKLYDELK